MSTRAVAAVVACMTLTACNPCGSQSTYPFNLFTGGMVWNPQVHYPGAAVTHNTQGGRDHYVWTYRLDNVCGKKPVEATFIAEVSSQLASLGFTAAASFATVKDPPPAPPVTLGQVGSNPLVGTTEWSSEPVSLDLSSYFDDLAPAWVDYRLDVSINAAITMKQIQDYNLIPHIEIDSTFYWPE